MNEHRNLLLLLILVLGITPFTSLKAKQATEENKELEILAGHPKVKALPEKASNTIYQQYMLTIAVLDNDVEFFDYLMKKYKVVPKTLLDSLNFNYTNLMTSELRIAYTFQKYKLAFTKTSILRIVMAFNSKKNKGILKYLLENNFITKNDIKEAKHKIEITPKFTLNAIKLEDENIVTSTGKIYRKVANHPVLGDDAFLDIKKGIFWTEAKKLRYKLAVKYCEKNISRQFPAWGLKCHVPTLEDYKDFLELNARDREKLNIESDFMLYWIFSPRKSPRAYSFASDGDVQQLKFPTSGDYLFNTVRCVCSL